MLMETERTQIVNYCKEMLAKHLTIGTGGNISAYDPESGYMAISPSDKPYETMVPEDVVVCDLEGHVIEAKEGYKPSSEYPMHSSIYKTRPDVRGIVHTHSKYCTILSTLRMPIPAVLVLMCVVGPEIPCANFHFVGSKGLAASACKCLKNRDACLLANHGMIAVGNGLPRAFKNAEYVESAAEVYYKAKLLGEPYRLTEGEIYHELDDFRGHAELDF